MRSVPGDREIAQYVRRTVYPYSAHYRALLDATGVGPNVRGRADLARVLPTDLRYIADPGALVLRPDLGRILRHGRPRLAAWAAAARVAGGMPAFSRHVERRFKPTLWVLADGVPIGYSADDASRLARRGAAWLGRAGVGPQEVVVSLLEPAPAVAYWQLVLGCRRAGVSALHLGPAAGAAAVARLAPSVLAGDPLRVTAVLAEARRDGHDLANLRTVLVAGPPLGSERRARLRDLARGAAVVGAWAPPGVRAVWSECRAGAAGPSQTGYHAWRDDVLETADDGEVLWTGIGWGGTALLRLRTFAVAAVANGRCPACGAPELRLAPHGPVARAVGPAPPGADGWEGAPAPTRIEADLDHDPEVAAWLVEYRTVDGAPETIVTLAPAPGVDAGVLVARLGLARLATRFVVLPADEVDARVRAAGGGRVVGAPPA